MSELFERTHRFNASARYSRKEIVYDLVRSEQYQVIVAQLSDRFGDQGLVGVMILRQQQDQWELLTLLISCRVMGRGVGETLVCHGLEIAKRHGQTFFQATYQQTAYNRMMALLFVTHGFRRSREADAALIFVHDLKEIPSCPSWVARRLL
jgi:FkbH-like protein